MRLQSNLKRTVHMTQLAGFTLVEMVIVMTVIVILGSLSTGFIHQSILAYVSTEQNVLMSSMADSALHKLGADIHNALPNSIRITADRTHTYLELVPIVSAGRYRSGQDAAGRGDALQFGAEDSGFDVLGLPVQAETGSQLVIDNLGIPEADVYTGSNVGVLTVSGNALAHLSLQPTQFKLASPGNRFFIVQQALSYVCDMQHGQLLLFAGYAIQHTQPASLNVLTALSQPRLVVDHVVACSLAYTPGVLQSNGMVHVVLTLAQNNSTVQLYRTFNVLNSP